MDLISQKEILEYLDKRRTYELMDGRNKAYGKGIRDAIKDIEAQPSVPAVPLDKLCEWLDENAGMPLVCFGKLCENCKYEKDKGFIRCWKALLKKWMEEQDADRS